jgi:hypothetical protein
MISITRGIVFLGIAILIIFFWLGLGPTQEEGFQAAICDSNATTVSLGGSNTAKCSCATIGNDNKQFRCATDTDATKLIKYATSENLAYLKDGDQICFTFETDLAKATYYCYSPHKVDKTAEDYELDIAPYDALDSYDELCDNLTSNLEDLSGSIQTIDRMAGAVDTGLATIRGEADKLTALYTNMKCDTITAAGAAKNICTAIRSGRDKVLTEVDRIDTYKTTLQGPLTEIRSSRDTIKDNMGKFKCK